MNSPLDIAVFACLTMAFYSCVRLGEFTVKSKDAFNPVEHITRKSVRYETDRKGNKVIVIFVPRTKTCPRGEDVAFAAQAGATDPYSAFERHLQFNNPDAKQHLFAHRIRNGTLTPLTRSEFLNRINNASAIAGFPARQGHSIRIGSTLEYLLRGVPFETVKQIGRWKSEAFTKYLRKHAQILAPYLQDSSLSIHHEFSRLVA